MFITPVRLILVSWFQSSICELPKDRGVNTESAATAIEYGLIAAGISLAIIAVG
jgi:hypothetical protein